jgi:CHASE2 domain-containing sensor protein
MRFAPWIIEENPWLVKEEKEKKRKEKLHSLSYEAIDAYQGVTNFNVKPTTTIGGNSCGAIHQDDRVYGFFIELTPHDQLPQKYRYEKLIGSELEKPERFKGKIVLVGVEETKERKYSTHVYRGWEREERYGLELQADAINSVLNGRAIRPLKRENEFFAIICLGLLGALIRYRMAQTQWHWRIGLFSLVLIVYLISIMYIYIQYHVLLNIVYHIVVFCFTYWMTGKVERRWFL